MVIFLLTSFFLFLLGAAVGSFINLVIYRSTRNANWVWGNSKCDHCGKKLAWYDNIPLLSYLILRGRSRCCHKKLSIAHPAMELLMGSLFVWWYFMGAIFFKLTTQPLVVLQPVFWLLVGIILLGILMADWLYYIIPDTLVLSLLGLAFIHRLYLTWAGIMQPQDLQLTLLATAGLTIFFALLFFLTRGQGFGFGDVKFALPMGLILGWPKLMVGVFLSFIFGSLVGLILLGLKKKKFGQVIPFGPFLVLGTFCGLLWGGEIWCWYLGLL